MTVNVKKAERRRLHFESLDDIVADAEAVTSGPHRVTGNWSAAQNFEHVAKLMAISNRGIDMPVPVPMKLLGRTLKVLGMHRKPFNPGLKPPAKVARVFAPDPEISLDEAIQHLRDEVAYAKQHGMTHPSPLFGKLSNDDWVAVHCRHAELHFAFIHLQ